MMKYVSTFIKYPEMETLKICEYEEYDYPYRHIRMPKNTFFENMPPKEFIVEFRVAKTYSDDGVLLCETHLLHNVFNMNALEVIKKL